MNGKVLPAVMLLGLPSAGQLFPSHFLRFLPSRRSPLPAGLPVWASPPFPAIAGFGQAGRVRMLRARCRREDGGRGSQTQIFSRAVPAIYRALPSQARCHRLKQRTRGHLNL